MSREVYLFVNAASQSGLYPVIAAGHSRLVDAKCELVSQQYAPYVEYQLLNPTSGAVSQTLQSGAPCNVEVGGVDNNLNAEVDLASLPADLQSGTIELSITGKVEGEADIIKRRVFIVLP